MGFLDRRTNMIIVIGGKKGGEGKSTTAINIAIKYFSLGGEPIIVDTDYQGDAGGSCGLFSTNRDIFKIAPRLSVIQKLESNIEEELIALTKKFNPVIVDTGGYDSLGFRSSLMAANYVITPIQASDFSTHTLPLINDVAAKAKAMNRKLKAYLYFNRVNTNPALKRNIEEHIENVSSLVSRKEFVYKLCKTILHERIAFNHSISEGKGIIELSDSKAASEFNELYEEIFNG